MTSLKKILIADDHALIRRGLSDVITTSIDSVEIFLASDGKQALDILNSAKINIAILDIKLPTHSGMEIAQKIKQQSLADKIIMITGFEDPNLAHKALLEIRVDAFLLKNDGIENTVQIIKALLKNENVRDKQIKQLPPVIKHQNLQISGHTNLSKRETQILNLIVDGLTSIDISKQLSISQNTVKKHRENINKKFGVSSPSELMVAVLKMA